MTRKPTPDDSTPSTGVAIIPNPPATKSARHRLTDDDRAEIVRLSAERMKMADIAQKIGCSTASVANIVRGAGHGRATRSVSELVSTTSAISPIQRRLIAVGLATVLGEAVDEDELIDLKLAVEDKRSEAERQVRERLLEIL